MTIDPTLITALATLLTALAALIKVLQHDGVIKQTKATVDTIQHQTNSQLDALNTKVSTLQAANNTRLIAGQATSAELAARDEKPQAGPCLPY